MKSRLNKTPLLIINIAFVILGIPQKSQALDLRGITDHLLKRGICAALQMDVGDCNPEVDSPNSSKQGESPTKTYPDSPQNSSIQESPTKTYPDSPQNSPIQESPTKTYPDSPQNSPIQESPTQPK
ncbi:hypothetical protein NIES267_75270 (plasmid) [Calothrix parasitica NIES-267]|uniref:Uncharacterized protein n=1 Tax=Calothrix parasitica NIES-267 TaxID=1973488 RepID=A0A1Z4M3F5_9CYAN|nr:hypothetical protein NIES267_75270 [Calothrix parasitica NIES-267]